MEEYLVMVSPFGLSIQQFFEPVQSIRFSALNGTPGQADNPSDLQITYRFAYASKIILGKNISDENEKIILEIANTKGLKVYKQHINEDGNEYVYESL